MTDGETIETIFELFKTFSIKDNYKLRQITKSEDKDKFELII